MTKVRIISKDGWMGHPKGSIVDVNDPKVLDLTKRKVATKDTEEKSFKKTSAKKGNPKKSDKMVRQSKNKTK